MHLFTRIRASRTGAVTALSVCLLLMASAGARAHDGAAHTPAGEPDPALRPTVSLSVSDMAGLRDALATVGPGTLIRVEPGEYPESAHFANIEGAEGSPVIISAADGDNPPIFRSLQFSDVAHLSLMHLTFRGSPTNGLNIDDGGSYDTPSHDVLLRGLTVTDVGPDGNRDGIKLSGLDDFLIEECHIERWSSGGSGIDMVGCHRGLIARNVFRYTDDVAANAVQMKGGTSDVTVRGNLFDHPGSRAVNIGGSTGFPYFRPPVSVDGDEAINVEARDILVEGNRFIGSMAPVAFVGVDGATVRYNTLYRPGRWAMRILQETRHETFVPSRGGVFTDNLIVFRSDEWSAGGMNIGPGADPDSFSFARNWWFCLDDPEASRPTLPTAESDGVYGVDPRIADPDGHSLRPANGSPAEHVGAGALPQGVLYSRHR